MPLRRSRRARCAGSRKRSCKSKSACAWKKSKGCRRRRSYKSRRSYRRRRSCSPCDDPCAKILCDDPCKTRYKSLCPDQDPCTKKKELLKAQAAYAILQAIKAAEKS